MNAVPIPILPSAVGLAGDAVRLWNTLVSHAGEPLPLAGKAEAAFTLAAAPPATATAAVVTTSGGLAAVVHVAAYPFKARFGIDLEAEDVEALPEGLRRAIVEGVLRSAWALLPDLGFGAIRIEAVGPLAALSVPAAPADPRWLEVELKNGGERTLLHLGIDPAALADRLGASRWAPRRLWPGLKARLPVRITHRLGTIDLTIAEAAALSPGDLVVMPDLPPERAVVAAEGLHFDLALAERGWRIQAIAPAALREPARGGQTLSDIPARERLAVTLQFDIGEASVPLADLETWQVGAVVPIGVPERADGVQVTVRANGTVVGSGDLVRIDDRIAVRLTRLFLTS